METKALPKHEDYHKDYWVRMDKKNHYFLEKEKTFFFIFNLSVKMYFCLFMLLVLLYEGKKIEKKKNENVFLRRQCVLPLCLETVRRKGIGSSGSKG